MKNRLIIFILYISCCHQLLLAQCPAVVPTFSVNTPNATGGDFYIIGEGVRNTAGDLAVIGLKRESGTIAWHIYFAVVDDNGNFVGTPTRITPVGIPLPGDTGPGWKAFITEAFTLTGAADGYMIAVNTGISTDNDIWAARLNTQGCVIWGLRLGTSSDGFDDKAVDIVRKSADEYAVIAQRNEGGSEKMIIHAFNGSGTACTTYEYAPVFAPSGITPVTSGAFGVNVKWAICGNSSVDGIAIVLLDDNFVEIDNFVDYFTPDFGSAATHTALDIIELNGHLFVSGVTNSPSTKGWLMKLSPDTFDPFADLQFDGSIGIDLPDNPSFSTQEDVPWDLDAQNNRIAVAGWTHYSDATITYYPWLLTYDENLLLQKSTLLSHTGSQFGALQKVIQNTDGYYLVGHQWNNTAQTGGTQCFIASCDENTSIGDCTCQTDQSVLSPQLMGGLLSVGDFYRTDNPCTMASVGALCIQDISTHAVCYQSPVQPDCSLSVNSIYGDCNTVVTTQANTTGFSGPVTYSWSAPGGLPSSGSGPSFVTDFPAIGNYSVCVTVTDGICTENACSTINLLPDQTNPVPICQTSLVVSLNAFGTATITINDVNNGSYDNCSLNLSLDKGFFDCTNLGLNTVTLTAIDNYGNTDFCQANVLVQDLIAPTIVCPASVTVNGVEDANHICNAVVNNIAATATDNCPPPSINYILTGATTTSGPGDASGTYFNLGVTTVTYTATDASGNDSNCNFSVAVLPCNQIESFEKLYGDAAYNVPAKIKAFGNYVYLAGTTNIAGIPYATFTKFDPATAGVIWDIRLDISSAITDFEYIPALESNTGMDGFILVGRTEPYDNGTPQDNNSLILRIDDLGTSASIGSFNNLYQLTGRETFTKIIKHPYPADPNYPYYVAGTKNPTSSPTPPSAADIVILMNINQDGNENFFVEYDYAAPDDEFVSGMFSLNNGNLVLTGKDADTGDGMVVEVNGTNGATTSNTSVLQSDFDIYDGIQLSTGHIILVGADNALGVAIAAEILPGFGGYYVVRFPDVFDFREIGLDASDRIYTVGKVKAGAAQGRQTIHRLVAGSGGTLFINFDSPETWYLEDISAGEFAWEYPHIYVSPQYDKICYADGRIGTNPYTGLGDYDILTGAYGLNDLATPAPQDCHFTMHEIPFQHGFTAVAVPVTAVASPHMTIPGPTISGINLICHDFCSQPCLADFTWSATSNCYEIAFSATATGTGPFTYAWDINCDGITDVPLVPGIANPVYTFPSSGTYTVCLVITDATGCQSEVSMMVTVPPDVLPPVIICPGDITVDTDPGVCYSFQSFMATATDNCPPVTISYVLNPGGGTNPATNYNLGNTQVTATATDQSGQTDNCSFTVTVADDENPVVDCPDNIFAYVPACVQGLSVSFPPATATDNCTPFTLSTSCSLPSGYFFPCGSTTVNCTATDASGNVGNCQFSVYVNCECMSFANGSISCNASNPKVYEFSLDINNLTGGASCTISIDNNQSGVTMIYNPPVWNIPQTVATVTGYFYVTDPVPNPLELDVLMSCVCPGGQTEACSLLYTFTPPCCEEVIVSDRNICTSADTVLVVLENCDNLYGVTQVNWYWGPCGAIPTTPKQVTFGCDPLLLIPPKLDDDICVYAIVYMVNNPCSMLTSNIAHITLCRPVSCSVNMVEECDALLPILPDPLVLTLTNAGCVQSIEWIDPSGTVVQPSGLTYQPPPLDYTGAPDDCYQDYIYTVRITTDCETTDCTGTVRFYNNDAPKGTITLDPSVDVLPICWGDDLALQYNPGCADEPPVWEWFSGPDGATWNSISGAGTSNPFYNTNELYDDGSVNTWFQVQSTNGVCPADTVNFHALIRPPLDITAFTAAYTSCDQTTVHLSLDYNNSLDCSDTVEWYHNGVLLAYLNNPSTPVTYDYTPGVPDSLGGYYYAVVKSCCGEKATSQVIEILPPVYIELSGPCSRCNDEIVNIIADVKNLPSGIGCSYLWTASNGGHILNGDHTNNITVDAAGTFTLVVTCTNGCTYTAVFDLLQCGTPTGTEEIPQWDNGYARLYPNPTTGRLTLEFVTGIPSEGTLVITDVLGRIVRKDVLEKDKTIVDLSITMLPAGVYFVKILDGDMVVWMQKVVKG